MAEQMINDWPWRERANRSPFAMALKAGDITWCWRDLQHRVDSLAAGFIQQGVSKGAGVVLRSKTVWMRCSVIWRCCRLARVYCR